MSDTSKRKKILRFSSLSIGLILLAYSLALSVGYWGWGIFVKGVKGEAGYSFDEGVYALSYLTQIKPKHLDGSYIGLIPREGFERDIALWKEWYRQNWWRVCWDPIHDEVVVLGLGRSW